MITRRQCLVVLGTSAVGMPVTAISQHTGKVWRIGALRVAEYTPADANARDAFVQALRERGYVEGKNLVIDYRFADGKLDRLPMLAAELVQSKVDVILSVGTPSTVAAQKATIAIPIVMVNVSDPVASGIVKSLPRPGGNITGLSSLTDAAGPKNLEGLRSLAPGLARVGVLFDPNSAASTLILKNVQTAAQGVTLGIVPMRASSLREIQDVFSRVKRENVGAVFVTGGNLFTTHIRAIADLAVKSGVLSASSNSPHADAGILMSYGSNTADNHRRAAHYVDRILKGAKPGELPVEQPTKFELVINLKTAKALGVGIPQELLLRADRVIE